MFKSFHYSFACLRGAPVFLSALLLSACAVGPDYQAPVMRLESGYARQDSTVSTVEVPEADAQFWRNWEDPLLVSLVDATLRANHDIRIALARYEQARALTHQTGLDRYPTLNASGEISDRRISASQAPGLSRAHRDGELHAASL